MWPTGGSVISIIAGLQLGNCKLLARRFYTASTSNKILLFLEPQNRQICFSPQTPTVASPLDPTAGLSSSRPPNTPHPPFQFPGSATARWSNCNSFH